MAKKGKYARNKLPLRSWLLYLCVALFLTTGVTYSKYIASSSGGEGAQAAQFGTLTLTENVGNLQVIPGVDITNDPKVTMTASEVAVRVSVEVTFGAGWLWKDGALTSENALLSITPEDGWTVTNQGENVFSFSRELAARETLENEPVFKDGLIRVSADISYEDYYKMDPKVLDISIQARAEQID